MSEFDPTTIATGGRQVYVVMAGSPVRVAYTTNVWAATPVWVEVNTGLPNDGDYTHIGRLKLDPANPNRAYLRVLNTLYVNPDLTHGGTWSAILTPAMIEAAADMVGSDTTHLNGYDVSIASDGFMVAAVRTNMYPTNGKAGVMHSHDHGATWTYVSYYTGYYSDALSIAVGQNNANRIVVDRRDAGTWYSADGGHTFSSAGAVGQYSHFLIPFDNTTLDQVIYDIQPAFGAADGKVYHSADGGATWTYVGTRPHVSQVEADLTSLRADPYDRTRVVLFGIGNLLESTNGGASWTAKGATFPAIGTIRAGDMFPISATLRYYAAVGFGAADGLNLCQGDLDVWQSVVVPVDWALEMDVVFDPRVPTPVLSMPFLKIEIDTNQPTGTPDWQDVTDYCRGWSTRRGRSYERDHVQTGTATITLDNRDRRFDPTYVSGPYYGTLKPLRRVRISATWQGVSYDIFTGYVESWSPTYPEGLDATVEVQASDGLMILEGKKITADYVAEMTDVRIGRILDAASWTTGASWVLGSATNGQLGTTTVLGPVGDRALSIGDSMMQEQVLEEVSALEHLYAAQDTENGLVYIDPSGAFIFKSRAATLYNNRDSLVTLGDADGEIPYSNLSIGYDLSRIYNDVRVTRTGFDAQVASDAASQADYFVRTLAVEVPLDHPSGDIIADSEALAAAQWMVSRYKDAQIRVASITLHGQMDDRLWPHILGRDLGDVATVLRRPPGGGDPITQVVAMQSVGHRFVPGYWETEWALAPQDTTIYWQLGDAVASVLGSTTTLAY